MQSSQQQDAPIPAKSLKPARTLFRRRRNKLSKRRFEPLCTADEIGQKLLVDIHAAFVFRQVSLVMGLQQDLYIGLVRPQRVDECLENRNSIFGPVSLVPERSEGQPVRGTVSEVELAVRV